MNLIQVIGAGFGLLFVWKLFADIKFDQERRHALASVKARCVQEMMDKLATDMRYADQEYRCRLDIAIQKIVGKFDVEMESRFHKYEEMKFNPGRTSGRFEEAVGIQEVVIELPTMGISIVPGTKYFTYIIPKELL